MTHESKPHVCPWWIGYFLLSPLRRIAQDPGTILGPYVRAGMTVLEIGPGMGFFSLPLARLVGKEGRVICVDVQEKMLKKLKKRAAKVGVLERITATLAGEDSLRIDELANKVDFVLAFAVVHEVPDQARLFEQIHRSLKRGSLLLLSEPKGHVTEKEFRRTIETARAKGFTVESSLNIKRNVSALLRK
ncbi:MAG: class I SAM-dependent methyltransferase [Bacteroidota bacterium]